MCIIQSPTALFSCGHLRLRPFIPSPYGPTDPTCKWASMYPGTLQRWQNAGSKGPRPPHPCAGLNRRVVDVVDEKWGEALGGGKCEVCRKGDLVSGVDYYYIDSTFTHRRRSSTTSTSSSSSSSNPFSPTLSTTSSPSSSFMSFPNSPAGTPQPLPETTSQRSRSPPSSRMSPEARRALNRIFMPL